jgi:hypothetical protein
MEALITFFKEDAYLVFLVCVVLYFIAGRRANVDRKKAVALVFHALFFFGLSVLAVAIDEYQLTPHLIWVAMAIIVFIATYYRRRVFPYAKHCKKCGATIQWKYRWIEKDTDCTACRSEATSEALG